MSKISIIIPILNEAETIEKLLNHLLQNSSKDNIAEIIIVDGGSTDTSKNIVNSFFEKNSTSFSKKGCYLVESSRGRAIQMNTGSDFATGNILYFLHADSFPPNRFDLLIVREVENENLAGCFKMKFDSNNLWLELAGWFTKFNWKACRGGDQSLFITKQLFEKLEGFDENFTIYEDIDLINKLYAKNEFTVIQKPIITSARRYKKNGIVKLQAHFWIIYLKKFFGASADELNKYYNKYIS